MSQTDSRHDNAQRDVGTQQTAPTDFPNTVIDTDNDTEYTVDDTGVYVWLTPSTGGGRIRKISRRVFAEKLHDKFTSTGS